MITAITGLGGPEENVPAGKGWLWSAFGEGDQRVADFPAKLEELAAGLTARVGVRAEEADGRSVTIADDGVGQPDQQLDIALAGCRVGHHTQRQCIKFRCGYGSSNRDGVGRQGREVNKASWDLHEYRHPALTHLGEQGASLLMLMAKSRHKKPENVRRYFKPSSHEAISELTSLLALGDAHR